MDFPDADELQWLEANQEEEVEVQEEEAEVQEEEESPFGLKVRGERIYENEDELFESEEIPQSPEQQSQIQIRSSEKKRHRTRLEIDDDDECARVSVRVRVTAEHENDKYLSRYASEIDGDCVPITAPSGSGERVYAKLDKQFFSVANKFNMATKASDIGLISEPVCALLQKAEQDALLKALQASSDVQNTSISPETSIMTEELWVNKYAPKSFTELLSDEQTNREVLSWLKQWDAAVFGDDIRNTGDEVLSALRRHSSLPLHQRNLSASFLGKSRGPIYARAYMGNSSMLEQENNRPKCIDGSLNKMENGSGTLDQKILLLCGPPGLGKTTLGHVAAKHCGYHVMEINASDDRSSTTIEAKILDAVQMNSVMALSKPKCLVIDEIDGALGEGKGAVEVILKMVMAEKKSSGGSEASTKEEPYGRKLSNKGRKSVSLSRPVICICNDLYAPPLRPLRHVAKVHVFAQPTVNRVVSRLKYICNREGMKISSTALTTLAEYTECDIRSCLNTLQFLHKKKETLNLVALSSQVIGRKDITRSVFDVWKEVFQKRKPKQSRKCDFSPSKMPDTHDSLYVLVSNRNDYELIFDGIHENFLQLHYHDPVLQKTVQCLDALGVSDLLHQCVIRTHNMSLFAYHPFIIITIHQLLGRVETPSIGWPKSFQRYRSLLMEKIERVRSWQTKIPPCISRHLSVDSFIENTVSPLLHILSPANLRPEFSSDEAASLADNTAECSEVAAQLLSEKEKNDMAQLLSTMVSLSLTYINTKSESIANNLPRDGIINASSLNLDPPIQGFVNFKGYKPGHYELTSAVKQVLVYEVEKQKIVQESLARFMHSVDSSKQDMDDARDKEKGMTETFRVHQARCDSYKKQIIRNASQKDICQPHVHRDTSSLGFGSTSADAMKSKSTGDVKKPSIGSFNFFDRFKKLSRKGRYDVDSFEEKLTEAEKDGHHLLFKFNEGFTNAVKRPVRIREFLL